MFVCVCVCVQVKDIMKDIMSNLQQTNSEKILLSWVRQCTRSQPEVNVLNFTTSWADGLAFNAILHRFRSAALRGHMGLPRGHRGLPRGHSEPNWEALLGVCMC